MLGVVGKDDQTVVCRFVDYELARVLLVADDDPRSLRVERDDCIRKVLVFRLAQQLLLAEIVDSEGLADTSQQSALEGCERCRNVLDFGLKRCRTKLISACSAEGDFDAGCSEILCICKPHLVQQR